MTPPARIGVFANQPNPLIERHRSILKLFGMLALAATVVQMAFFFLFSSQVVLKQQVVLSPHNAETTLTTKEFALQSRARSLRVKHSTDVENNWVDITSTLIEKKTGEAYQGAQEISYYRGVDEGENWSEGSRDDAIAFKNIPPGDYYLTIEYDLGTDRSGGVVDTVEIIRNPVTWSNYALVMIFLAVFPLVSRWRREAFETRRWNESDLGGNDAAIMSRDQSDDEDE